MANYLPLLLVSVSHNAVPDDTSLSTQARGQVDYLSHEWREEDVWRSWRNMTRQKNEIANGARLENASWRTWWKQRNKLKTISPETLNWSVLSPYFHSPIAFVHISFDVLHSVLLGRCLSNHAASIGLGRRIARSRRVPSGDMGPVLYRACRPQPSVLLERRNCMHPWVQSKHGEHCSFASKPGTRASSPFSGIRFSHLRARWP